MTRALPILLCLSLILPSLACGQVTVERKGEENPVVTVAKSTFWGGVTGLVLGSAIALVAEDNEEDIVKWFFVTGVFGGFAFGIYHVASRPEPHALIHFDRDGLAMHVPEALLSRTTRAGGDEFAAHVTLVAIDF